MYKHSPGNHAGRAAGLGQLPLLVYAGAVFLAGGLVAYPVYLLSTGLGWHGVEFDSVVHRCLKIVALLGLWPLMRYLKLTRLEDWGFGGRGGQFTKNFLSGFVAGIAMLGVLCIVILALEIRYLSPNFVPTAGELLALVVRIALSGVVIALAEEVWFRGALFQAVSKTSPAVTAIAVTAVLYGCVHFLDTDAVPSPLTPDMWSGLVVVGHSFAGLADPAIVGPLLALVSAGVLLGLVRLKTGSVAQCIGLHAGWLVAIKTLRKATDVELESPLIYLAGGYDGVIGYLAFVWFTLLSITYFWVNWRRPAR